MEKKQHIELLDGLQRVEAPPYLLTRINAQLKANEQDTIPKQWISASILAFCALLIVNVFVIRESITSQDNISELIETMNLLPNDNLYE